ncbi:AurF N-oxygenase family protein [Amycolatopsis anabasis]|uniref:AurF N-oxygenase family protein n=1 Tax=Amycolatopsis anabasis TaxID=1840409 RepID=UPI00131B84BA|nr:diiron oxygenase [Amycolatopsis anabasis]
MGARDGRERTAERLLQSSADKFYDPAVDIDWSAPIEPDKYYLPEHRISLYGTALWDRMTPEQRFELGKQEIASITSFGIFAEVGLMHMLLNTIAEGDPTSRHAQYALTEIADECRHSTMFGRSLEKFGVRPFLLPRRVRVLQRIASLIPTGPAMYGGALLIEEMIDRLQRETMADENMQPHIRMVNRIHVLEEARHITYAREELRRLMPRLGPVLRALNRVGLALAAWGAARVLIDPRAYKRAGLDPWEARKAALANPHYRESVRWMGERLVRFLDEAGMIKGRVTTALWRRSFLLGGRV